jgi:rod shape-determining protein MreC
MAGARAIRNSARFDQMVFGACLLLALIALVLPLRVREPVAASLRRTLLAPMVMLQERAELSRRAFLLHEERVATRDSVTLRALGVAALEAENERLRQLTGLGSRLRWGFVPAEALHGRGVRDAYTVILTAGSRVGVRRLSPVVAPEGLVGMVERVDPTMSQAILWTHPDFRVSVMSADGSAFGIAQAHLGTSVSRFMLEMRGVPFRATLQPGALVVSAGIGGTYPRGIPVGTVVGEVQTSEAWARTYILRPAVMPADINSVMILRPERVAAGVQNVWQYGTGIDPMVQAIVAAGDSLARATALAEAAARRAVQDTIRRADSLRALMGDTAAARRLGIRPGVPPGGAAPIAPPVAAPRPPVQPLPQPPPATAPAPAPAQPRDTVSADTVPPIPGIPQ